MKKIIKYLVGIVVALILVLGIYAALVKFGIMENVFFPATPDMVQLKEKESFVAESKNTEITVSDKQLRAQYDPNDGPDIDTKITSKAQFKP